MSSNRRGAETRIANISTQVAPTPGYKYDVFLSFRGPDTRRTVADVLYESLVDAGFSVFRDNEELSVGGMIGPELERAIDDSRIHVPIFSKGYASSAWCLQELARMVKRRRESAGHEIVPIFYGVSPSDVRHKRGSYGEDLIWHEGRYGEEKVREWSEALTEVADLKGWDAGNAPLGKLVNDLVRELSIKLKKRQKVLPVHLVGVDDPFKEVMELLHCGSMDRRFLVVHGMGGVGKTTLAKIVFNKIYHMFDGSSFLLDVRENSKRHGIVRLQNQLLSDILKRSTNVHDVDDGVSMIQERFRNESVLIVLDDVDQRKQLMGLMGNHACFGPGSRIIVTTRNVSLLPRAELGQAEKYYAYEIREMNPVHALRLFSKHAFTENHIPDDLKILSRDIVDTTGRIPLGLEVFGSFLRGKSVEIWVETLQRLRKVPNKRVQKMFTISFEDQQIFLHVACFFMGHERRLRTYMWENCGFSPESSLAALTNMSLLKIDRDRFSMQDQLSELEREIVQEEDDLNAGNRSRL